MARAASPARGFLGAPLVALHKHYPEDVLVDFFASDESNNVLLSLGSGRNATGKVPGCAPTRAPSG